MINRLYSKFIIFLTILISTLLLGTKFNLKATDSNAKFKTIKSGILTVGTNATFPPFEYVNENGQVDGFDIKLIQAIAKKIGLQCEITDMEFGSLLSAIDNKIDVIASAMTKTEQRAKVVDFSDVYLKTTQYIITTKNRDIKKEESLKGLTVATQTGTTSSDCAKTLKDVKLKEYNRYSDIVSDILNKRVDLAIFDENTANTFGEIYKNKLKVVDASILNFKPEEYSIACSKQKRQLLDAINKALFEIKNDPGPEGYNALVEKYIKNNAYTAPLTKSEKFINKLKANFNKEKIKLYSKGFITTLKITIFAAILGFLLGIILAILKLTKNKKGKKTIIARISSLYIDIIRGTPVLVQLLIMYYVILASCKNSTLVAVIAFGLNSAAYVAEILRGGINAVNIGQTEAGCAMGFTYIQTMLYIVLPQGLKNAVPALCNEFISLLKETAVVGYVALLDLTRAAYQISTATYEPFLPLITVTILYFLTTKIISLGVGIIEKKING